MSSARGCTLFLAGPGGVGRDVIVASTIVCFCVFFIDKIDNKLLMMPRDFSLHFFFKNQLQNCDGVEW